MEIKIGAVVADGFEMDHFSFGEGEETAVIIPGLNLGSMMASAKTVANRYAAFAERFTVYLFDRRRDPPPTYTVREMADDTAEAMDRLGIRGACVFGASQGGMIAMEIAAHRPDLVKKLALASTAVTVPDEKFAAVEKWIELAEKGDGVGLCLDFGEKIYPEEIFDKYRGGLAAFGGAVSKADLRNFSVIAAGMRGFDASRDAGKIKCPVFVAGDRGDRVLGEDEVFSVIRSFGDGAQTYVSDGCGHAMYDTAPDFADRLLRFFTE